MLRTTFLILVLQVCFLRDAFAQSEHDKVREVIDRLFSGMHTADSSKVRSVFAKEVTMATVFTDASGKAVLKRDNDIKPFILSIANHKGEPLTEEIWDVKIDVDGDLAQAWCKYAFYVGKKFSHCGVDALQFHRTADGWKIFHLADTRQRTNCSIPPDIEKKYKN